jgi:hypothetical protein
MNGSGDNTTFGQIGDIITGGQRPRNAVSTTEPQALPHYRPPSVAISFVLVYGMLYGIAHVSIGLELGRLEAAICNVTSHDILMRRIAGDGSPTQYVPGLGVVFAIIPGEPGEPLIVRRAQAMPTIRAYESLIDLGGCNALHARYPHRRGGPLFLQPQRLDVCHPQRHHRFC